MQVSFFDFENTENFNCLSWGPLDGSRPRAAHRDPTADLNPQTFFGDQGPLKQYRGIKRPLK